MIISIYTIFLKCYFGAIGVYALFNRKARKWIDGRADWEKKITDTLHPAEKRIWIHCASLGEFEQGRPVIELLRKYYTDHKTVITFFSPSGYDIRKNDANANYVFYLPLDGSRSSKKFISLIDPSLVIFIKYEFWHYYLEELHRRQIPVILVSAAFRKSQPFFSWYGKFFRDLLNHFTWIFVQDQQSADLLKEIGLDKNCSVSGDTRYDTVSAIASTAGTLEVAARFKDGHKLLIAGSTWPSDEKLLAACLSAMAADWKLVIAPHEVDVARIKSVQEIFGDDTICYSRMAANNEPVHARILIIDNIGLLARLFAYGDLAYIGGGFNKSGIHNVLEPAVFGLPVLFGPVYKKFVEACTLVAANLAFPVTDPQHCREILVQLTVDAGRRASISASLQVFMQQQTGASQVILNRIDKEKWLGNSTAAKTDK